MQEPSGGDTWYEYTARGELAVVTNDDDTTSTADDITITLGYDLAGRKTSMVGPGFGGLVLHLRRRWHLITQTDGRGTEITLVRDDLGRIKERRDTTGANNTLLAAYTYDVATGVDYAWRG